MFAFVCHAFEPDVTSKNLASHVLKFSSDFLICLTLVQDCAVN